MSRVRNLFTAVLAVSLIAGLAGCAPAKLEVTDKVAIVDVRTPEAFAISHMEGAINVDYSDPDFMLNAAMLKPADKFYVYGETSDQAGEAASDLMSLGLTEVTNLGNFEDAQVVLPVGVSE
jgi:rhodanese-related sulfurtransferase